jgi:hypothetical protein
MTKAEFNKIATEKFTKCSVKELKKEAIKYNNIFTNEASLLFDAIISALEIKMS